MQHQISLCPAFPDLFEFWYAVFFCMELMGINTVCYEVKEVFANFYITILA